MNILITGGAGYVGSVVIPKLIEDGHYVKCLDRFFFGDEFLSQNQFANKLELIRDDIRWFKPDILEDIDVVLDLAAISNDPAGDLNPEKTYEINHKGRARVAKLSKENGVERYVLASSASIYGQQNNIADENFIVTVLRFSSVYGNSTRMRFDTAVNCMVLDLFKNKKISVRGKLNKRPFIHIKDVVRAYQSIIDAPKEKIRGQIFNVGSEEQNFEMGKLAQEIVKASGINCDIELNDTNDHRSYFASFQKIRESIGYSTRHTVSEGVMEMYDALTSGKLTDDIKTKTVEWYKKLLSDQILAKRYLLNNRIL